MKQWNYEIITGIVWKWPEMPGNGINEFGTDCFALFLISKHESTPYLEEDDINYIFDALRSLQLLLKPVEEELCKN